jgi:hypothetical protein
LRPVIFLPASKPQQRPFFPPPGQIGCPEWRPWAEQLGPPSSVLQRGVPHARLPGCRCLSSAGTAATPPARAGSRAEVLSRYRRSSPGRRWRSRFRAVGSGGVCPSCQIAPAASLRARSPTPHHSNHSGKASYSCLQVTRLQPLRSQLLRSTYPVSRVLPRINGYEPITNPASPTSILLAKSGPSFEGTAASLGVADTWP